MKNLIKSAIMLSIWTLIVLSVLSLTSCGSTKVAVSKPAEGTSTTITVTTNNPITTSVTPNVELNNEKGK